MKGIRLVVVGRSDDPKAHNLANNLCSVQSEFDFSVHEGNVSLPKGIDEKRPVALEVLERIGTKLVADKYPRRRHHPQEPECCPRHSAGRSRYRVRAVDGFRQKGETMNRRRRVLALLMPLVLLAATSQVTSGAAKTKKVKIRGYITALTSPTSFEIEDYRISRDEKIELEFENESPEVKFGIEDLRIGTEVEISGDYNEDTNELTARKMRVDLEQFKKLKHTAIVSRIPEGVQQTEQGWRGAFYADGRRIIVDPTTDVLFKLNKSEKKLEEKERKKQKKEGSGTEDEGFEFQPLKSLAEIRPGIVMSYEGPVDAGGAVRAERVEFMRNELEKGEANLWKSLKVKEKPPQFEQFRPGELKIDRVGKFKLLPSREVQEYVTRLGRSLIPAYQRNLPDGDPAKIPFRFYVISGKTPNAFALANGVIVIHSSMIEALENEGQLAAVVGHEIAHSVQEHTWRLMQHHKKKLMALRIGGIAAAAFGGGGVADIMRLVEAAIRNGYSRSLENQADRVGLEYMVAAGYDPRQAPRVWKLMAQKLGDRPTNLFWSSHDNNTTRRSYLMLEIRNNYGQMDMSGLHKGEQEYARIVTLTRDASSGKKRIKVK